MRNKVLHKRTKIVGNTPPPSELEYGELAINYANGQESFYIKNDLNTISTFPLSYSKEEINLLISEKVSEIRDIKGVVLFENSDGLEDDIILSDSLSNYTLIKVFCMTNDKHRFIQEFHNPNNSTISVHTAIMGHTDFIIKSKVYDCLDKSITITKGKEDAKFNGECLIKTDGTFTITRDTKFIKIYKIIGYKYF